MEMSERKIINLMKRLYQQRLSEALEEADVVDSENNVIIGKDLKVRHKKTQYEYTVDDVLKDSGTGEIFVKLRLPDQARFDPPAPEEEVIVGNKDSSPSIKQKPELLDEDELDRSMGDDSSSDNDMFIIDKEEFEKEYEVK